MFQSPAPEPRTRAPPLPNAPLSSPSVREYPLCLRFPRSSLARIFQEKQRHCSRLFLHMHLYMVASS